METGAALPHRHVPRLDRSSAAFGGRPIGVARFGAMLVLFDLLVVVLRDRAGGDGYFLAPLLVLPLGWAVLYGERRHVLMAITGFGLALAAPALTGAGQPAGDLRDLEAAAVWTILAPLIALPAQRLVSEVRSRAAGFRSLIDASQDAFVSLGDDGRVIEWNRRAEAIFGWSRAEALGAPVAGLIVPEENREEFHRLLEGFVATEGEQLAERRIEATVLHRSGQRFPVELSIAPALEGERYVFNVLLRDVSQSRESEQALREAEERFRRAFSDSGIGMAIASPEGRWIAFNTALGKLTGHPPENLLGMRFSEITHPEDFRGDAAVFGELVSGERDVFHAERRYIHADGHLLWVGQTVSAIRDEEGKTLYLVAQMQDVTEHHSAKERLEHQALHDPLTGLPNRTLFDDRIRVARDQLRRGGQPFAVMFVDLDRFKEVNDSFGHEVGDRLLVAAGQRLLMLLRATDTAARFGGDEFMLLCEGLDEEGARHLAGRIIDAFSDPLGGTGAEIPLTVSIGMSIVSDPEADLKRVLRQADAAMYAAKSEGRARWALYRQESDARADPSEGKARRAEPPAAPAATSA